jgi:hypothetical protein
MLILTSMGEVKSFQPPDGWKLWKETFGERDRPSLPFTSFEPHIYLDNLPERQAGEVKQFLKKLHSVSGAFWKPGRCRDIDLVASWAHDILKEEGDKYPLIEDLQIKRRGRIHFWLELEVTDIDEPIIVDPMGVPRDSSKREQEITPYFGLLKDAKGFAKRVYEQGEEYDGTTRELPPGFHP